MTAVSGVTIKKDAQGRPTHLSIDLRKHPEAIPALKKIGLMPNSDFEKDCEDAITLDELEAYVSETIRNYYAGHR